MQRRFGRSVGTISAAVILAACSASSADVDRARDGASASPVGPSGSASTGPSAAALAVDASLSAAPASLVAPEPGVLPRSVTYGILSWTVTDAVITNQDPRAYVVGVEGAPTAKTSLIVDLDIRNDNVHVTFVSTSSRLVATLPDTTVVPGTELTRTSAPPVSSVQGRYAFAVPAGTDFDGLGLRFEDPGREPSLDLPLSGPAPEVESDATIDTDLRLDVGIPGIDMRWTIDKLLVGRDWPLPIGFKGGTLVPGARAETGHRWVGIVARVDVGRCDCKGGVLDQSGSARLLVDGLPYTASAADTSRGIMNASTFSDVMLVFDVPASAGEAVLQVGPLEKPEQQASAILQLD